MRRTLITLMTGWAVANHASAETPALNLPAPSPAETDRAEPDWYEQFTFSTASRPDILDGSAVWAAQPAKTFHLGWIKDDRWSLSVDLTTREDGSPLPREEMLAEAEFRITPRISIGGELSIGADELDDTANWDDQDIEAGVRLRSAFKF